MFSCGATGSRSARGQSRRTNESRKSGTGELRMSLDQSTKFVLSLEGVTKTFDGFKAINELNFYMDDGELRTVIGPNGAGKSTMLDIITGRTRPDKGKVEFGFNTDLTRLNEYQINRLGIGRKFQTPSVYVDHTVFENIWLSLEGTRSVWSTLFSRITPEQRERIEEVLKTVGLAEKANSKAGLLSHGQKQWLEIGMLLAQNPKVLLVDEPAAGMTDEETHKTGELLMSLAGKHSIVVIEHDMVFVRQIARKVTVLHQGTVLCEGTVDEVQNDERVIEVYLGRKKKA
jgi:urea transport system ATP-binding protein